MMTCTDDTITTYATLTRRADMFIGTLTAEEQLDATERLAAYLAPIDAGERGLALSIWLDCDPDYRRYKDRQGWK